MNHSVVTTKLTTAVLLVLASLASAGAAATIKTYALDYTVDFNPVRGVAEVEIAWGQRAHRVREMRFNLHPRIHNLESNASLVVNDGYAVLTNIADGTRLTYEVEINNLRDNGEYDARMTDDWAVWRGDDLIPPARIRQLKNTESDAYLTLTGPRDWSFVAPFNEVADHRFAIENDNYSFDRPTGWMVGGNIGVRTENIRKIKVAVAGPVNQNIRRMDILAFLNWTLPAIADVLPEMPSRLLIVSAGDGMWRGGLSAGNSLYVHADRPLISGNGTSTLLHELIHVTSGLDSVNGADWIIEGLAEYYSIKLLRSSGTVTRSRVRRAFADLEQWSVDAGPLDARHSTGATTAKAALIMRALDMEIREKTDNAHSLDDVFSTLVAAQEDVSLDRLRSAVESTMGASSDTLTALKL